MKTFETEDWEKALRQWAESRTDVSALVQIGSRVQAGAVVDRWSDFDYQLITSSPRNFADGQFASEIAPCWSHCAQPAFGNVIKVTAVYAGALEADFVILNKWEMVVATTALGLPSTAFLWPRSLKRGTDDLRTVAGRGWRVIKGGKRWQSRYEKIAPHFPVTSEAEFKTLCSFFWTQVVWATKKTERGEWLAAQRCYHLSLMECAIRLLEIEATMQGRPPRPEARRAEAWLDESRLASLQTPSAPEPKTLRAAIENLGALFAEVSTSVAAEKKWALPATDEIRAWAASPTSASAQSQQTH